MTNANQPAKALETRMITGDTFSIDAVTDDGKKITTLVRIILEFSETLDPATTEPIGDLFMEFVEKVEELF